MSLLMLTWFVSGFVMMYVDYPGLTLAERLVRQPALDLSSAGAPAYPDLSALADASAVRCRLLRMPDGQRWLFETPDTVWATDASTGLALQPLTADKAARIVSAHYGHPVLETEYIDRQDQWLNAASYVKFLPAYRMLLDDAARTSVYLSARTGTLMQEVTAREKLLAWLGPIPHWIYPRILIQKSRRPVWRQVIIWSSTAGILAALSGIAVGLIRWRKRARHPQDISPYQKPWLRWHHYAGLLFGLVTCSWVLSGLFSVDPFRMRSTFPADGQQMLWRGSTPSTDEVWDWQQLMAHCRQEHFAPKEIHRFQWQGQYWYLLYQTPTDTRLYAQGQGRLIQALEPDQVLAAFRQIAPDARIEVLHSYDQYYLDKHQELPLPVFRVSLREDQRLYIAPKTLQIHRQYQATDRTLRWLYHGLHSWDLKGFYGSTAWYVSMSLFLLGGSLLSLTSLVLGVRYLRNKSRASVRPKVPTPQ